MSRTYVIADLHGRFDLLCDAIPAIADHHEKNDPDGNLTIITLGDYVDRGPNSAQVIDLLMNFSARIDEKKNCKATCLQGNHEQIMVKTVLGTVPKPDWWISNGGAQTLYSYSHPKLRPARYLQDVSLGFINPAHIRWLAALPMYHEDEHRVYVHAGVPANHLPLKAQDPDRLLWMLYDKYDHGGYRNGDKVKHVVHGHHQFEDGPHVWSDRTDLDTMAWYTGRLVVGVFDDDKPGGAIDFIEVKGPPDPRYK